MKPIDLTGQRFGRLIALRRQENDQFGKARWLCRCDCGGETITRSNTLRKRETRSCGCLHAEAVRRSRRTHGRSRSYLYRIWCSAKARCHNPTDAHYKDYGARGITMCDAWRASFAQFLADVGERPSPHLTLGRKDNNGPYNPENCRWESYKQQGQNKRDTILVRYKGKALTLGEWATRLGIAETALYYRLRTSGWSIQRTLETPSTPPKGEAHPGHKLTDQQVHAIRTAYGQGTRQAVLSRQYGVCQAHISRIIHGRVRV
jgi:hypothetical protein